MMLADWDMLRKKLISVNHPPAAIVKILAEYRRLPCPHCGKAAS